MRESRFGANVAEIKYAMSVATVIMLRVNGVLPLIKVVTRKFSSFAFAKGFYFYL